MYGVMYGGDMFLSPSQLRDFNDGVLACGTSMQKLRHMAETQGLLYFQILPIFSTQNDTFQLFPLGGNPYQYINIIHFRSLNQQNFFRSISIVHILQLSQYFTSIITDIYL